VRGLRKAVVIVVIFSVVPAIVGVVRNRRHTTEPRL
jgi:hypothetical protein